MTNRESRPSVVVLDGLLHPFHDFSDETAQWESAGFEVTLAACVTEADVVESGSQADVLVYWGLHVPVTRAVIEALNACRLIVRYGTGIDSVDLEAATEYGIPVAVPAGYCTREVADHATALLMTLARRVVFLDRPIRAGGWSTSSHLTQNVRRLAEQTLGLIGFGRIAQQVARNMEPMIGRTVYADPYIGPEAPRTAGAELVDLDELLEHSDLISVHVPLEPETRHLIGSDQIERMKPGAFVVNTSRGPVIDEAALIGGLQYGHLGGAGLDVFATEPLPDDSPLRTLDNVVLTPHFASSSEEAKRDMFAGVTEIVVDALSGRRPYGVVNRSVTPRHPFDS